jgi:Fis family transcriptional regulator
LEFFAVWLTLAKGCLTAVVAVAGEAARQTFLGNLTHNLFDAAWNTENRAIIWSAIVLVLLFAGAGLPIPEDIPLTVSGFTTFKQSGDQFVLLHYVGTFCVVVVPILIGDIMAYSLGRRWGFELRERVRFIARVLAHCDGNLSRAAAALGMHRNTLSRKMAELHLKKKAS